MKGLHEAAAARCKAVAKRYHASMQSSVAAIRGARPRAHFARPLSHHRERRLGLPVSSARRSSGAPRAARIGPPTALTALRRTPRMIWTRPSAPVRSHAGDPAAPWRD
jgi:hypothetical protein